MATLTAAYVRGAGPGKHHDQHGLILPVLASGSRQWIWRGTVRGRRRDLGLGSPPYTTLAEARQTAFDYRKLARQGGDPATLRADRAVPTFSEAMEKTIETQRVSWKNGGRTAAQWRATLGAYALPKLGDVPINSITSVDVVNVLLPVWSDKPDTARRLRRRISTIMQAAVAEGHRLDDPAGPALTAALPKPGRKPANHYTALPHAEVGAAIAKVRALDEVWIAMRLCFEFIALTACRSGEARTATWAEIDRDARVWVIPAQRTKMAKELRTPLSTGAVAILHEARKLTDGADGDLLFPGRGGGVQRDTSLAKVPRQLGLGTVHGLRSSFRSFCSDSGVAHAAAELALGHVIGSATVAAYARSDLLEVRSPIMQKWADYLEHPRTG